MITWSHTPPTVPGWYWRKSPNGDLSVIKMELYGDELASVTTRNAGHTPSPHEAGTIRAGNSLAQFSPQRSRQ
jgi:hypothetical protein